MDGWVYFTRECVMLTGFRNLKITETDPATKEQYDSFVETVKNRKA